MCLALLNDTLMKSVLISRRMRGTERQIGSCVYERHNIRFRVSIGAFAQKDCWKVSKISGRFNPKSNHILLCVRNTKIIIKFHVLYSKNRLILIPPIHPESFTNRSRSIRLFLILFSIFEDVANLSTTPLLRCLSSLYKLFFLLQVGTLLILLSFLCMVGNP
jgi:hypothetical protein